jgi:hypothetical protein
MAEKVILVTTAPGMGSTASRQLNSTGWSYCPSPKPIVLGILSQKAWSSGALPTAWSERWSRLFWNLVEKIAISANKVGLSICYLCNTSMEMSLMKRSLSEKI